MGRRLHAPDGKRRSDHTDGDTRSFGGVRGPLRNVRLEICRSFRSRDLELV